jgi:hypothetical protein
MMEIIARNLSRKIRTRVSSCVLGNTGVNLSSAFTAGNSHPESRQFGMFKAFSADIRQTARH